jgi:diguanylate cyclase (GGDEF)-like protein
MALRTYTLLFVEDDPQIQTLIKSILEEDVKAFYQAYNGEEGWKIYTEKKPDIILTDINMPGTDGMAMAKKIKTLDRDQPILMMSAYDDREILLDAINFGIDGFIVKPVDMVQLNRKLEHIAKNLREKSDREAFWPIPREAVPKEEMDTLYTLAHYDTLTGIPNRYLFHKRLDTTLETAHRNRQKFALFFIDLDNFKSINDTYGHKAGDLVLQQLTKRITGVIREEDTLARIGGDEFALIVADRKERSAIETIAQKITETAALPLEIGGRHITLSCSIGISCYPAHTTSKEELLHFADLAMYQIKSEGKSSFRFYKQ